MRTHTAQDFDHEHDLRKHEPRPGERDYVPLCAQAAPISTAMDIALCVRSLKNLQQGAELIQRYAELVAGQRIDEAAACRVERAAVALETPLSRREPNDAQA